MIRRPPRSTRKESSAASDVYKRQGTYTKDSEMDKQVAREKEKWVCSICGKNTYNVEYDYIGSGTNHLGCELKSQEEIDEYIEDIDEQAYAQGRGSSKDVRREKNSSQKKHEDKVFGYDQGGNYEIPEGLKRA